MKKVPLAHSSLGPKPHRNPPGPLHSPPCGGHGVLYATSHSSAPGASPRCRPSASRENQPQSVGSPVGGGDDLNHQRTRITHSPSPHQSLLQAPMAKLHPTCEEHIQATPGQEEGCSFLVSGISILEIISCFPLNRVVYRCSFVE